MKISILRCLSLAILVFAITIILSPHGVYAGWNGRSGIQDSAKYPWSALGRLNMEGHGFCTGVLVSPNIVYVKINCLWNSAENRPWHRLVFRAGYQQDTSRADVEIVNIQVPRGYRLNISPRSLFNTVALSKNGNWALLTLEYPIGYNVGSLGLKSANNVQRQINRGEATFLYGGYFRGDAVEITDCTSERHILCTQTKTQSHKILRFLQYRNGKIVVLVNKLPKGIETEGKLPRTGIALNAKPLDKNG